MPYSDLEKRREYHREYMRWYMKTVKGSEYRTRSEDNRSERMSGWKQDLYLDYKLRRINKTYGVEGLRAFERDNFSCTECDEWDIRVLVLHHLDRDRKHNVESNLLTLCGNCHMQLHFLLLHVDVTRDVLDQHFMRIAEYYGRYAKCFSRHVGALLVDFTGSPKVISLGRNGPPSGVQHCNTRNENGEEICPRQLQGYASGQGLSLCTAAHAERNAIALAAREGKRVEGCTLYANTCAPCLECAKSVVNSGISEVVVEEFEAYETQPITGMQLLLEAGVKIRPYSALVGQSLRPG